MVLHYSHVWLYDVTWSYVRAKLHEYKEYIMRKFDLIRHHLALLHRMEQLLTTVNGYSAAGVAMCTEAHHLRMEMIDTLGSSIHLAYLKESSDVAAKLFDRLMLPAV